MGRTNSCANDPTTAKQRLIVSQLEIVFLGILSTAPFFSFAHAKGVPVSHRLPRQGRRQLDSIGFNLNTMTFFACCCQYNFRFWL